MILGLLLLHLAVCGLLAASGRRLGRRGLLVGAVPPAVTAIWSATRLGTSAPQTAEVTWVKGLDLGLTFRVDAFGDVMTLIVSGIGALVFVYAHGYFSPEAAGTGRFATTLLAFSTAMLGLVWSDSVWSLFIFWELTSVTSFLLIGHKSAEGTALAAARRTLMITGGGGLVLLAGLLLVARAADTTLISQMLPAHGASAVAGAVLVMVGAATKSAQTPFHVWLPGAMVAPTPVSAYLHSATMVKAGVVLVAVLGPALGHLATWQTLGLAFGIASLLWGAGGALRHRDAKLILAWGTVSQLGMLITLFSAGTPKATLAALALLVAHALFKGALFLVVGEVDVRAGTRNVDELGGLARSMPGAFWTAVLAGLSMAGAPPLLGFVAKEAAIEAALALNGPERWAIGAGVIAGSVLTVAYTVRLLVKLFGPGPRTEPARRRTATAAPAALLAAAGVAGYAALGPLLGVLKSAAGRLAGGAEMPTLYRWPGLTAALGISLAVLAAGLLVGLLVTRRQVRVPAPRGARWSDQCLEATLAFAKAVTGRVQHGSLPVYLVTMTAAAALATIPFLGSVGVGHLFAWDTPLQAILAATVVGAALGAAAVGTRLGAGLALGAAGITISAIFVIAGAPDLVLTQLLVETVIVVGFVLAFGRLSRRFPPVGLRWRSVRLGVAGVGGAAVVVGLLAASHNPAGAPPIAEMVSGSVGEGGGKNVVNVILTDMRALDTLGEVVVLAVVAVGILALARAPADSGSPAP
ncbi:MAG: DUF4040 domain-containing protein [Acidimicrobiia bacterium]|nr:DUF4040 domain-containing protein [Acidimicrobiia bacterium]